MQTRTGLIGVLAVVLIAAGVFFWQRQGAEPGSSVAAATRPAPLPASGPAMPAPVQPAHTVPSSMLPADDVQPVGVLVERLLATKEPQKAYAAYLLISACTMFNGHQDVDVFDEAANAKRPMAAHEKEQVGKMCGGMTERERQSRLDYLAIAVKGGVPGTALAFANEGPFGDPSALQTRPDDPLVREWKALAATQLQQAAEAGDPTTLLVWGAQNLGGTGLADKNPVQGYGYLLAFGFTQADQLGPDTPGAKAYADSSELMNAMAAGLTPAQRAAAIAEARRIADQVKARRGGSAPRPPTTLAPASS